MPEDIKKPTNDINRGRKITWAAPEFAFYEKDKSWYTTMIITAIVLIIVFILLQIYAGAAVVVAAALVFLTQGGMKPKQVDYTLDNSGIHYNNKSIEFSQLKSYWIVATEHFPRLYLQRTGKFSMPISIFIKDTNPELVRSFLKQYLPEEEDKGDMIHENINRFIRF